MYSTTCHAKSPGSSTEGYYLILNFLKILLFIFKRKFSFYFVPLFCRFLNSETCINFSSLTSEIFVKTQNFDSYDVIMT